MFQMRPEERERYIQSIQDFFYEERDEEIGVIAAEVVLSFILEDLGKALYNKGVDDCKKHVQQATDNMLYDMDALLK